MAREIESKYLIDVDIEELKAQPGVTVSELEQYYLFAEDTGELRFRKADDRYFLTIKGGGNRVREEVEVEIFSKLYDAMKKCRVGRLIRKTRYRLPHQGYTWEIDIYHSDTFELDSEFYGLKIAEVEVNSEDEYPKPPDFLTVIRDVTFEVSFKNRNLAIENSDDSHIK